MFLCAIIKAYVCQKKISKKSSFGLSTEQVVKIQTLIVLPQFLQAFWPALPRREHLPTWIVNMRQTPSRSSSPSSNRPIAFEPGHLDNAIRNLLFLRLSIKFQQIPATNTNIEVGSGGPRALRKVPKRALVRADPLKKVLLRVSALLRVLKEVLKRVPPL